MLLPLWRVSLVNSSWVVVYSIFIVCLLNVYSFLRLISSYLSLLFFSYSSSYCLTYVHMSCNLFDHGGTLLYFKHYGNITSYFPYSFVENSQISLNMKELLKSCNYICFSCEFWSINMLMIYIWVALPSSLFCGKNSRLLVQMEFAFI